jgi:hypothetical protein
LKKKQDFLGFIEIFSKIYENSTFFEKFRKTEKNQDIF